MKDNENNIFLNSNVYKYFDKNFLKDKDSRDLFLSFEEILIVKKNIKSIYNTDDPEKIKLLIGKNINGVYVTEKDFKYVLLIFNTYKKLYFECKNLLREKSGS